MPQQEVMFNTWPDSQHCCGCIHGLLADDSREAGATGYICFKKVVLADKGKCAYYEDEKR